MDVSLHMDGGGYARADGRETPCEEHFDPLGGRNAQQRPVCSALAAEP
jgi:hypothetical protein